MPTSSDYTYLVKYILREPGVEPGTIAWKATMLTVTPFTLTYLKVMHRALSRVSKAHPTPAYLIDNTLAI